MALVRGKKGHCEYFALLNTMERIEHLEFQLNLGNKNELKYIESEYRAILEIIANKSLNEDSKIEFIKMFRMIAETRDIHHGKGLRTLSFMMIQNWYDCYRFGAKEILSSFVYTNNHEKPYGSWKDMKYFCDYCVKNGWDENHEIIVYVVEMMNEQLKRDWENMNTRLSMVSKWIPREKSRMGWLYKKLVENYFPEYFSNTKAESKDKAWKKAAMEYRKIIAFLNRTLDTVQIKQCDNQWSKIDFSKVSKATLLLQKNAWFNVKKNGEPRTFTEDRIVCSQHIREYINDTDEKKKKRNPNTVDIGQIVRDAVCLIQEKEIGQITQELYEDKKKLINYIWRENNEKTTKNNGKKIRIAMIDFSSSMNDESLNTAIGLACRIALDSCKRILTFSGYPTLVNLEDCETFVDCVEKITKEQCIRGINTNFYSAFAFITETLRESHLTDHEIKEVSLVILSDMQMDIEFPFDKPVYETMKEKCHALPIPEVYFWNLQTTKGGFACVKQMERVNMVSGNNPKSIATSEKYDKIASMIESFLE